MIQMETNDMEQFRQRKVMIENEIRDIINRITNTIYISHINVSYQDGIYKLQLGLNCKEASPMSLGYQGDEQGFLKYVESEFRKRKPHEIRYTYATLLNEDEGIHYPIIEI